MFVRFIFHFLAFSLSPIYLFWIVYFYPFFCVNFCGFLLSSFTQFFQIISFLRCQCLHPRRNFSLFLLILAFITWWFPSRSFHMLTTWELRSYNWVSCFSSPVESGLPIYFLFILILNKLKILKNPNII